MNPSLKPIHLFADSQLLFWRQGTELFLDSLKNLLDNRPSKAAYVGASNGDNPDYYSIFKAAMENIAINDCRMIQSDFTEADAAFVDEADVILLAGGDVREGWDVMSRNGLKEAVLRKYQEGALLIGISAGAVQLGLFGWPETTPTPGRGAQGQSQSYVRQPHSGARRCADAIRPIPGLESSAR
ncbi:MAG TPA: Type 1 glutamine amidotransferase-like domain-containing protein [Pyrinomonadaceae bacterium]|nr:Type 1 glutamine amidotransferase-like domain-containing protein [Pyrinomonadaceae bacterium]